MKTIKLLVTMALIGILLYIVVNILYTALN